MTELYKLPEKGLQDDRSGNVTPTNKVLGSIRKEINEDNQNKT